MLYPGERLFYPASQGWSYEFGEAKRYDVLSHSYDFAFGKSYGMIALVISNVALPLITQRSCS